MDITILCSSAEHPVNTWLEQWAASNLELHKIRIVRSKRLATGGDLLFLISCSEIVGKKTRARYGKTLVIHASDLPLGRGWSPHIWTLLDGASEITLSLLEA